MKAWARVVEAELLWQAHQHGEYHPVAVDITAFYRPRLQGCATSHYSAAADKALPAILVGIIARVGSVGAQRFGLPLGLVRADWEDPSPGAHRRVLLKRAVELQEPTDLLVTDREFTVGQLLAAGATVWVTRLLKNMTARRADPPPYRGRGARPKRGEVVRHWRGDAGSRPTRPPGLTRWTTGVRATCSCAPSMDGVGLTHRCTGQCDLQGGGDLHAAYAGPLLVATPLDLAPQPCASCTVTAGRSSNCRWPPSRCWARPASSSMRTKPASVSRSSRSWPGRSDLRGGDQPSRADRLLGPPAKTYPGRLRRLLAQAVFPTEFPFPARLRGKMALTDHLPKGFWGQRRRPTPHLPAH